MKEQKVSRPKARLPRGFRDRSGAEIAAERKILDTIRTVYESYGFAPLETPAFEYTDALGKFLPDVDRPNEGVFSLQDDDGQWLSLRYDHTAPLARYVAENFQFLPKPFRRYAVGPVWRNEKPGPGRFRQFTQFDADTVGSNSSTADAELLMMLADTLEALCLERGEYVVKVNNRKLLDGVLEAAFVDNSRRGTVLRAVDKLDRLGVDGVRALLGEGRKDDSGDFTKGAGLNETQIERVLTFSTPGATLDSVAPAVAGSAAGEAGLKELEAILSVVRGCGFGEERIAFDTGIVRGLDYYTGPVFEAQLTFKVKNDDGQDVVFGSVAGGGRYDDLVARFTGQTVPATGVSIGVSRLLTAMTQRGLTGSTAPLIVVLAMGDAAGSFAVACELRAAGFAAEAYVGNKKVPDQLKYADKRGAALVVMEGDDERDKGEIILKDLKAGAEVAKTVETRADWVGARAGQSIVKRANLVAEVEKLLGRT